jgi:hypothetical protein
LANDQLVDGQAAADASVMMAQHFQDRFSRVQAELANSGLSHNDQTTIDYLGSSIVQNSGLYTENNAESTMLKSEQIHGCSDAGGC